MHAVPGNDGLTFIVYKHCWDILSFPEFVPEDISDGLWLQNQQTFKFFGSKPQKKNFHINICFKKVATPTMSKSQLPAGDGWKMQVAELNVLVINGVHGRCFPNIRCSTRQRDRPSSIFFIYGLDA